MSRSCSSRLDFLSSSKTALAFVSLGFYGLILSGHISFAIGSAKNAEILISVWANKPRLGIFIPLKNQKLVLVKTAVKNWLRTVRHLVFAILMLHSCFLCEIDMPDIHEWWLAVHRHHFLQNCRAGETRAADSPRVDSP